MMRMRWWNWVGAAMLVILLFSYGPISLFVSSDTENIKWVVVYIMVAALLNTGRVQIVTKLLAISTYSSNGCHIRFRQCSGAYK